MLSSEPALALDVAMDHIESADAIVIPPRSSLEQKWDFLKPHIERLYVHQGHKLG